MNFELNNIRKDADLFTGKFHKASPVVEVFAAMVNGESLERFGAKANEATKYIQSLAERAENGDGVAVAELNTMRRFIVEMPVMEELKLLGIFGSYKNVGINESIEREVPTLAGERSRVQAPNSDVVFPMMSKTKYPVATQTVSAGYKVDYRRIQSGDMTLENEGLAVVKTDLLNRAKKLIMLKVYDAIAHATVAHKFEGAGLTKTGVDAVMGAIRRYGKPTFFGDNALVSQLNPFAGYVGSIASNTITGVSEKTMNDIATAGHVSMYNGGIVAEIANPYNEYALNAAGNDFETILPVGLGFVVPAGVNSPIATYTRGGLTSMTGNDVATGSVMTRFDIEVGCDVAKGHEHKIGMIYDTNLGGLE